jgi:hypoxanthine phosphoribosyltransferase
MEGRFSPVVPELARAIMSPTARHCYLATMALCQRLVSRNPASHEASVEENIRMNLPLHIQEHGTLSLLWSREAVAARVAELALQISRDYAGTDLLLVGVLKGAFVFLADLMRALETPVQVEFVRLASYGTGTTSANQVRVLLDLDMSIAGRHVLIVEDILDTGQTLGVLLERLRARQPASLKLCVLLNKRIRRIFDITADYTGFDVPDGFVVGYGIDYAEHYRHLPAIYTLTLPQ